jgi:putative intracellular protease/amidase
MLVLDAFKGLLTPEIKSAVTSSFMDTDLVVIPGGITSQLQTINKPFKDHLKQLYSEWHLIGTML